jgi:hypothetical protein
VSLAAGAGPPVKYQLFYYDWYEQLQDEVFIHLAGKSAVKVRHVRMMVQLTDEFATFIAIAGFILQASLFDICLTCCASPGHTQQGARGNTAG